MKRDQHTELYGVIGFPVRHSLSPALHNAAFSATGMNAVYLAFETRDLDGCIRGMRALQIKGLSVTIPHKTAVIPHLDHLDELSRQIGAVNTIVNRDGRLSGCNTDARGALDALAQKIPLAGKTCLLVGAGGAARAIGFALKTNGVRLVLTNRGEKRGQELADALGCRFRPLEESPEIQPDILIHATPVGMTPDVEGTLVPRAVLRPGMVVMDIVYSPLETRLLQMAGERGCVVVNGLEMFVRQGAEQFRFWTGMEAPLAEMRRAVGEML